MAARMMRSLGLALVAAAAFGAAPALSQSANSAPGGVVRVLDKITGRVSDVPLRRGETADLGLLRVRMDECRYPSNNPTGDAYIRLELTYKGGAAPIFSGWMVASAPALNPLDHPRFDVWALRCVTS